MANEFTSDGKYIFIDAPYAEVYIPDSIMLGDNEDPTNSTIAYDTGESVVCIGIFYMRFFESDDQDREKVPLRTFTYPNKIEMKPSGCFSKPMELTMNGVTDTYRVYKFYKGDIFMEEAIKKSYLNTEMFTKLIMSGNIPKSLTYDELFFAWYNCFKINGLNTGIPPTLMQAIIAKMCRSSSDLNTQFRMVAGRKNVDPRSYRILSMNQVSAYSSVMSSMAFERFAEKLTTSLNMTKEGTPQEPSPIEGLITI